MKQAYKFKQKEKNANYFETCEEMFMFISSQKN